MFPPEAEVGVNVWSGDGYEDHGPAEGPKVNIAGGQCGEIVAEEETPIGQPLCTVRWADGSESKHYASGLDLIGNCSTPDEFEAAIEVGPDSMATVGKGVRGGFKGAVVAVTYQGERVKDAIVRRTKNGRAIWKMLEGKFEDAGVAVEVTDEETVRGIIDELRGIDELE